MRLLPLTCIVVLANSVGLEEFRFFQEQYGRSCQELNMSSGARAEVSAGALLRFQRSEAAQLSCLERFYVFNQTAATVDSQNAAFAAGKSTWRARLNKYADYTPTEKQSLLGYRRIGSWFERRGYGASLLQGGTTGSVDEVSYSSVKPHVDSSDLALSIDWRDKNLKANSFVLNQASCGSCWAMASIGALEYYAEINGARMEEPLSWQELVDCVPNPKECGGNGGCGGATAELAFEYVKTNGLATAVSYHGQGNSIGTTGKCESRIPSLSVSGWLRLPENKLQPLMQTVAQEGPVVVSVSATNWISYDTGILDSCKQDAIIDHAVLLLGYGADGIGGSKSLNYWLLRNSWGLDWGEGGHIRLLRHDSDEGEAGHCGVDPDPKQGVGCKSGPPTMPVCGMCGILSDSSYPRGVAIKAATAAAPLIRSH